MAAYPEPYVVLHRPLLSGGEDEMGEPVKGWGDPVPAPVYGWAPPSPDVAIRALESGLKRDLDVYCATPFAGPGDLVVVNGTQFKVEGYADDFNHGPFAFQPGYRINLSRVEG
ncbi:hypothetical protein DWQ67_02680 [Galactobacter caseinivorans]|uniref:Head-to-tail stopper n=2 Tax=Galactobacter caseinivorans TaxID=2676123 RepID=A0A496PMI2_9MICC|nr:hypothetical protein DWQ67_02680 [Galactobacter caseinivorans]